MSENYESLLRKDPDIIIDRVHFIKDTRLCMKGADEFMDDAEYLLDEYNFELSQIMSQYDIHDEGEILSGFIYKFTRRIHHEKDQDITSRIAMAVQRLRNNFHDMFWYEFTNASHGEIDPNISEMRVFHEINDEINDRALLKASAWYQVAYDHAATCNIPLLSFGYIVHYLLCEILERNIQG